MKTATVSVSFDDEKLSVLRLYLKQKDLTLEKELTASIETLYTKHVPTNVREYIAIRLGDTNVQKKKNAPSKRNYATEVVKSAEKAPQ